MSLTCQFCDTTHQSEVPFCRECGYPLKGEGLALEGRCIGNYRLVQRIGGGGFGEVYRAEHVELGKPFAVKILHARLSSDEQFVERFRNEAMVLAGLQHENVVQVVDFGQHPDIGFYLVMEWLEGRSLHRVWRRKRVFPLGQVYALFSQLLDALQLAHSKGVVHRDMKPENILLVKGSRGRTILKIVDFGIATIVGDSEESDPLNQSGVAVGTPYYMSPEQAKGDPDQVDHRSDIYACGVILVELLAGRRMFKSKDPKKILRHQIESPIPRLKDLYSKVAYSDGLQGIIDKALAKDKAERFASASEFYDALDAAMKADGVKLDDEDLDATQKSASSTNLLALVGVTEEHESLSSASTPNYQGQKSTSQGTPSISGAAPIPPAQPQWALWGGVAFGFVLTVVLGLTFFWNPTSTPKARPNPMAGLPPLDAAVRQARPQPARALSPDAPATAAPDAPATRPPTRDRSAPIQRPTRPAPIRRRKLRKKQRRRPRTRRRTRRIRRRKTRRRKVAPRAPSTYTLIVRSHPSGASVYINGKKVGTTTLRKSLPAGKSYTIRIKKSGFISSKPYTWNANGNLTKKWSLIEDL